MAPPTQENENLSGPTPLVPWVVTIAVLFLFLVALAIFFLHAYQDHTHEEEAIRTELRNLRTQVTAPTGDAGNYTSNDADAETVLGTPRTMPEHVIDSEQSETDRESRNTFIPGYRQ